MQRIGPDKNIHYIGLRLHLAEPSLACLFREFRYAPSALLNVLFRLLLRSTYSVLPPALRLVQFLAELLLLTFYDRNK